MPLPCPRNMPARKNASLSLAVGFTTNASSVQLLMLISREQNDIFGCNLCHQRYDVISFCLFILFKLLFFQRASPFVSISIASIHVSTGLLRNGFTCDDTLISINVATGQALERLHASPPCSVTKHTVSRKRTIPYIPCTEN